MCWGSPTWLEKPPVFSERSSISRPLNGDATDVAFVCRGCCSVSRLTGPVSNMSGRPGWPFPGWWFQTQQLIGEYQQKGNQQQEGILFIRMFTFSANRGMSSAIIGKYEPTWTRHRKTWATNRQPDTVLLFVVFPNLHGCCWEKLPLEVTDFRTWPLSNQAGTQSAWWFLKANFVNPWLVRADNPKKRFNYLVDQMLINH